MGIKKGPMTIDHPDYIPFCKACEEAILCGLHFEETHSTQKPGFIQTDKGFIKSPH